MSYVHGEIVLGLKKDSFKIQDSKEHEEMSELVLSLEDAHQLFVELDIYFGSRQQKLEDLKGIWQEPSSKQFPISSSTSHYINYQDRSYQT